MKLLTKELLKAFEKQGDTGEMDTSRIHVIAKFFNPMGAGTWYAVEFDPENKMFFGYVSIHGGGNDELGSFSLLELEDLRLSGGLKIERDLYFDSDKWTLDKIICGERP